MLEEEAAAAAAAAALDALLLLFRLPDLETGRQRTRGGSVQVVVAAGQRDSLEGTQMMGPDCDQMIDLTLL